MGWPVGHGQAVGLTSGDGFLQIFDSPVLAGEAIALLMVQPAELLQNLGVVGVSLEHALIGSLGVIKLRVVAISTC